jgi:hypothetical protein
MDTAGNTLTEFGTWRQHCLDDALDLIDQVLFSGSARTQPGLRPAWQAQLREALTEPRRAALDSAIGGLLVDTLSGITLVSDDEVNQSIRSRGAVQAMDHAAEWPLRELATLTLPWHAEAAWLGHPSPVLLEPATLAETLDRALNDCVPSAARRLELWQELTPSLVSVSTAVYERQCAWLQGLGKRGVPGMARPAAPSPAPSPTTQATRPAAVPRLDLGEHQVAEVFERLCARVAGQTGMAAMLRALGRLVQASAQADPTLRHQAEHPAWRLADRLVALAQLAPEREDISRPTLHARLKPLADALERAPQPLLPRHYEQALFHLERLAPAALPEPLDGSGSAQWEQAQRQSDLQPLVRAQIAEQLRRTELVPAVAQFLLGDWVRVVAHTSAREGVEGAGPRRWTRLIDDLCTAADQDGARPPTPAALECLLLEVQDGLRAVGEAPAKVERLVADLGAALIAWPRRGPAAAASDDAPETATTVTGSADMQSSGWLHHADLATVPVAMDEATDTAAAGDRQRWLAGLQAGDLCRASLQGRWTTVRLDWISDNGQFFAFSRRQGTPFCASRRVLERMRGEGLITTIPPGDWLRDAVAQLPAP